MMVDEEIERIAAVFHQAWMHWANAIMETENISEARKAHWKPYMVSYEKLDEKVKEQDRGWARLAKFNPNHQPN
jgi:hypothetical protein